MDTLLIDDDAIGVFLTARVLRRENFSDNISSLSSAEAALAFFQEASLAELPRVVFLDLNMPVMNGWSLLEALRPMEEQLLGRCHIYILTSSMAHADASRVHDFAFVSGLVHKPIDSMQIQAVRAQLDAATAPD